MTDFLAPFRAYLKSVPTKKPEVKPSCIAPFYLRTRTYLNPNKRYEVKSGGRVNVMLEGSTFDECQALVFEVMEEVGTATFTIPAQADDGQFVAFGHYKC